MSIIEGSAFIDLAHLSERSASRQLAQSDAPLTGTVSAVVDAERGLVEVQIDGSDDLPVVAVADAGLTYVGARVSLPRDSSGRVVGVKAPSGEAPAGVEVVPVGEGARRILASEADIARLDQARADLEAARTELESSQAVLSENLAAAEQSIQTAQERADAAASGAAAARDAAAANATAIGQLTSAQAELAGAAGDAWNAAVAAQARADAAVASAVNLAAGTWPADWYKGIGVTDAVSMSYAGGTSDWSKNTYRVSGFAEPIPDGRIMRATFIVDSTGAEDTLVRLSSVYYTISGSYVKGGEALDVTVPAGTVGFKAIQVTTIAHSATSRRWTPRIYVQGGSCVIRGVEVVDVTEAVAAQAAAQAAADAAVAAQGAASAASQAATQAQSTADGKNTITRSPLAPSGTGKTVGDVWWRFADASLSGPIIGQWTWSGSSWSPSTIDSQVIASLTVDKLAVTGGARFQTAVMNALVADDAFVERLYANRMVVSAGNLVPDPYFDRGALTWSGTLVSGKGEPGHPYAMRMPTPAAGSSNMSQYAPFPKNWQGLMPVRPGVPYYAECSYFVEEHVPGVLRYNAQVYFYNADNVMVPGVPNNLQAGRLDPGNVNLNDWNVVGGIVTPPPGSVYAVVKPTVYVAAGSAECVTPVYVGHELLREAVGSTLIEPGAITTPKLAAGAVTANEITASDALWAKLAAFVKVTTAQLIAGGATITEQLLAAQIVLQSDLIAGSTSSAYVILNGQGLRAFRMIGGQLVQVLSLGTGSADYLSVTDGSGNSVASIDDTGKGVFAGVNAGDSLTYRGREMSDMLADGPRGVVGYGAGWPWSGEPRHALSGEESIFEATLTMEKGRLYSIRVLWGWCPTSAGSACEIRLRHTVAASGVPASPTSSTSVDKTWRDTGRDLNQPVTVETSEYLFAPASSGVHRWLVSASYAYSTGVTLAYDAQMPTILIEDVGPLPPMITAPSKVIAPSGASTPTAQQRRSKTFYSSGYKTFVTNGGYPPSTGPGHGSYGSYTYQSMIFFPNMTADLAGATILNAAVYVHANHFYATSGNTLAIGMHGASSAPSAFASEGQWSSTGGWSRGEERWIQIPSSLWQGLKDGGYRGITLEAGSSYGYTYPAFAITVDYVK